MFKIKTRMKTFIFLAIGVLLAASCATSAATGASPGQSALPEPEWVSNPRSLYSEDRFISAVGYGRDRESAEKSALGSLAAVFGQRVQGETTASYRYSETAGQGSGGEESAIENVVKTSVAMDSLLGAEIGETWYNGADTYFAAALMEKLKCSLLYDDIIESNQRVIEKLTQGSAENRDTLDMYMRYDLAAEIADANAVFLNVLSVLSPAVAAAYGGGARGEEYRAARLEIARNIPIEIVVAGDHNGRVRAAFGEAIAQSGFRTGGGESPYRLDVDFRLEPLDLPNNPNKFTRYTVNARLVDRLAGTELFPYAVSGREGHLSVSEANNRALRVVEQEVKAGFKAAFDAYLSRLSKP